MTNKKDQLKEGTADALKKFSKRQERKPRRSWRKPYKKPQPKDDEPQKLWPTKEL